MLRQRESAEAQRYDPLGQCLRVDHDAVLVSFDATQPEKLLDDPGQLSAQLDICGGNGQLHPIGPPRKMQVAVADIQAQQPHQIDRTRRRSREPGDAGKFSRNTEIGDSARHCDEVARLDLADSHPPSRIPSTLPAVLTLVTQTSIGWLSVARMLRRVVLTA